MEAYFVTLTCMGFLFEIRWCPVALLEFILRLVVYLEDYVPILVKAKLGFIQKYALDFVDAKTSSIMTCTYTLQYFFVLTYNSLFSSKKVEILGW